MKKLFSSIMALLMIFQLGTLNISAVSQCTVSVGEVSGTVGSTVSVPITIADNPGIASFKFKLNYDNTKIKPVQVSKGDAINSNPVSNISQSNIDYSKLTYVTSVWGNESDITDNGILYTVDFEILEGASGTVALTLAYEEGDICNQNLDDVDVTAKAGNITVISGGEGGTTPSPTSTPAASTSDATITVASVTGNKDDLVDVPVTLENNPGIAAFSFLLSYDNTKITPVSITPGNIISEKPTSNIQQSGIDVSKLNYVTATWGSERNMYASGVLYIVTFKVLDDTDAEIPLTLSYTEGNVCNQDLQDVNLKIVNGKIITRQKEAAAIEVTQLPDKIIYAKGEEFDPTGMIVNITYMDWSQNVIKDYTVTGFDSSKVGTSKVKVQYNDLEDEFDVTIVEALSSVGDLRTSISNRFPNVLDTVNLVVRVNDNQGFATGKWALMYDNNLVEVVDVEPGEVLNDVQIFEFANTDYGANIVAVNPGNITGDGILFTVHLKVNILGLGQKIPITIKPVGILDSKNVSHSFDIDDDTTILTLSANGDVDKNGVTDTADALMLEQYVAKYANVSLDSIQKTNADTYTDYKISVKDVQALTKFLAKQPISIESMGLMNLTGIDDGADVKSNISMSVKHEDEFSVVTVSVKNNKGFSSFEFNMDFEKTKLQPISIEKGDLIKSGNIMSNLDVANEGQNKNELTEITSVYSSLTDIVDDGTLFTVVFKRLGESGDTVHLTANEFSNSELANVDCEVQNSISISAGSDNMAVQNNAYISNGQLKGTLDVSFSGITENGVIITAIYQKNILVGVFVTDKDNSDTTTITIPDVEIDENYPVDVSLFVWDNIQRMKPLVNSKYNETVTE